MTPIRRNPKSRVLHFPLPGRPTQNHKKITIYNSHTREREKEAAQHTAPPPTRIPPPQSLTSAPSRPATLATSRAGPAPHDLPPRARAPRQIRLRARPGSVGGIPSVPQRAPLLPPSALAPRPPGLVAAAAARRLCRCRWEKQSELASFAACARRALAGWRREGGGGGGGGLGKKCVFLFVFFAG